MNDHHHPLYGVLLILLSGLLLASHDGLAKHLSEIYPVFLVIWARYVAQTVLMKDMIITREESFGPFDPDNTKGTYNASIPAGPGSLFGWQGIRDINNHVNQIKHGVPF